jgi:hypothetical protein
VRRGASWTAAYHLQLTVAAVARPVRSSMMPLGVPAAEPPWLLLAQAASARRSFQPASRSGVVAVVDTGRTPAVASVAGRCPACGVHHPVRPLGSGGPAVRCPAVRCPVTWGRQGVWRSGRLLSSRPVSSPLVSTRPVSTRPVSTRLVSSRLVSAPSVRTRPSPPTSDGGVGDQVAAAGTRYHGNGSRSRWAAAPSSGSVDGRGGLDAGDAAQVARRSAGSRWRTSPGGVRAAAARDR